MALRVITSESPDEEIASALRATIAEAVNEFKMVYEGEYPRSGIGVSEIRPRHVGISTDYWQFAVTTAWADWINTTISDNAYVLWTGIFNLTIDPALTALYPSANGNDMPRVHIEQMYSYADVSRAWLTKSLGIKADGNFTLQVIGTASQTEKAGLLGFTVAKKAYLIAATPS